MTINLWGAQDPVQVAKGGTGQVSLTADATLLGQGSAPIVGEGPGSNGQLLIGTTGADPSWAAFNGTTNEIATQTGSGTLSIGIADNPIFPGSGAVLCPAGTTAQRPSPVNGMFRYNTTEMYFECVEDGAWTPITIGTSNNWVWLDRQTVSAPVTEVVFDSSIITSTFYEYFVIFQGVEIDGAGVSDFVSLRFNASGSPVTTGYSGNIFTPTTEGTETTRVRFTTENGTMYLLNLSSSTQPSSCMGVSGGGAASFIMSSSIFTTSQSHDGLTFYVPSGNDFLAGIFEIWGLQL